MLIKPQILYYALLKYSEQVPNGRYVIDDAIDRLVCTSESSRNVSMGTQLSSLERTVKVSHEVESRLLEARWSLTYNADRFDAETSQALLARALEAAAVCYAMQRFTKKFASFLSASPSQAQSVRYLLQTQGEKVLASVGRDIDVFGELHGTRTLEMHGTLLALVHLRRSMPSVYKLIAHQQNKSASPRKDSTRFRTVSMTLEYQDGEASPKYTGVLQGRRAFSLEAHAGIPLPTLH